MKIFKCTCSKQSVSASSEKPTALMGHHLLSWNVRVSIWALQKIFEINLLEAVIHLAMKWNTWMSV